MKTVLERWAQLEPERCVPRMGDHHVFPIAYYLERRRPRITGCVHFTETGQMQMGGEEGVFFAVIEAIEAHGWEWSVGTTMQPRVQAHVTTPKRRHLSTRAEDATAALLGAYLTALEAEREVTP